MALLARWFHSRKAYSKILHAYFSTLIISLAAFMEDIHNAYTHFYLSDRVKHISFYDFLCNTLYIVQRKRYRNEGSTYFIACLTFSPTHISHATFCPACVRTNFCWMRKQYEIVLNKTSLLSKSKSQSLIFYLFVSKENNILYIFVVSMNMS